MASKIDEFVKSIHTFRWYCCPEKESDSRVIAQVTDEGYIEIKNAIIRKCEASELAKWLSEMTHDPTIE